MNLETLAASLETAGVGVRGKSIFVNFMPEDCKVGIVLMQKMTGTMIDYELPNYRHGPATGFQLIVRHSSNTKGLALINQAAAALTMVNTQMMDMWVNFSRPKHDPVVFPRSTGNLLEFSVNFEANYVLQ